MSTSFIKNTSLLAIQEVQIFLFCLFILLFSLLFNNTIEVQITVVRNPSYQQKQLT
jgi:hypothetical protein